MPAPRTRGGGPGCCCTDDCAIGSDTFDGEALDEAKWTEESGTWSLDEGKLVGEGAGLLTFIPEPATADDGIHLAIEPQTANTTATFEQRVAIVDEDNYHFGRFAIAGGIGTLTLGTMLDGEEYIYDSLEVSDTDSELNEPLDIKVCWQRGIEQEQTPTVFGAQFPADVDDVSANWTSENNTLADDGSVGAFSFPSSGTPEDTGVLTYRWNGVMIDPGATIDGATIGTQATGGGGVFTVVDLKAQLVTGSAAFDDKSLGTAIGTNEVRDYGGTTDAWGGLTWRDVNDPTFTFQLQYRRSSGFTGGGVTVDYAGKLTINYTPPPRKPGRLQITYRNTGSPNAVECLSANTLDSAGTGTALKIIEGDWTFDSYTLEYLESESRPDCPACLNCDEPQPGCECITEGVFAGMFSEFVVLDLGAGGWTDGTGTGADCYEGEHEIGINYPGDEVCGWFADGYFTGPFSCPQSVYARVRVLQDDDGCYLFASVNTASAGAYCAWESARYSSPPSLPIPLSKVVESIVPGHYGGSLPNTVYVDN